MPTVTSLGIGSGLDLEGLINQLVIAEGTPTATRLDSRQFDYEIELSAVGSLESALDSFSSALDSLTDSKNFEEKNVSSTNEELFTVTALDDAVASNYTLEVVRLAQAQKLESAAFVDAGETAIGTGTITIDVGGASFEVEISGDENTDEEVFNTLEDIRDAINNAEDNTGVVATIVTGADGAHLIFTAEDTGAENTLTITTSGGDGNLDSLQYDPDNAITNLSEIDAAQDAELRIDSVTVFSASNTVTGAIQNVTIDLISAEPGTTATLKIEVDDENTTEAVKNFVNSYNALLGTIDSLTSYDPDTGVSGTLQGDSLILGLEDALRAELNQAPEGLSGDYVSLADLGITTSLDGTLELDEAVLDEAVAADRKAVAAIFTVDTGYAVRFAALTDSYVDDGGLIDVRTEGLEASIADINGQREDLESHLNSYEERLRAEFLALDLLVAELTATSDFLTAQLAALPGFTYSSS